MVPSNVNILRKLVNYFIPTVNNAYKNLLASNEIYRDTPYIKDNSLAKFWQDKADNELLNEDPLLALEYITRAIALAEDVSDKIPALYTYRARLLQVLNYWEDADEDIQRAFTCSVKDEVTESFLTFLQQSAQNRPNNNRLELERSPRIPDYEVNNIFPCATINIRLLDYGIRGERVEATSKLHISENLVVEEPLVIAPIEDESILYCHECMMFCVNPVPCFNCSKVTFCAELCRELSWRRYHKYECYIQYITDKNKQHRLAVKIALSFRNYICLRVDNRHCPLEYWDILHRKIRLEDISDQTKNDIALFAAQVFHGLRKNTTFFKGTKNPQKFDIFKGLLMRLMLIVNECKQDSFSTYKYFCNGTEKELRISWSAIYTFAKYFRTGCAPNVSVSFCNTTLVVKSLRIIQPGEELFIAGDYHYTITPKEERQAIFRKKYSIACECEACENDWPLGKDLERRHQSNLTFNLHLIGTGLDVVPPINFYAEDSHALVKDYIGIHLVRPSMEWLAWQTFLIKVHRCLSSGCDAAREFLKKAMAPILDH